ncbi:Tim44 domain-containing protein [Pseudochrobactrum kiredjianiae]|uniref:Tim44 domain-containing protein n=1 Tax=Pseudochrobactrum kiredjianiae TaxID=386305 RepID=A0ABW3V6D0_9HYPH|nr:Tim44 domain-containing protein [Pseudochrobactrum kiredjianiae]MDM7850695.1 Tim44 domain-containing protein [Pseudochrobactrum kiredjianiae]
MFRATSRLGQFTVALGLALVVSLSAMDIADARRAGGGGFGSRGSKTFQAPAPTRTAPNTAAPIERSMTPNTGAQTRPAQGAAAANAAKPGFFNNFGRSMLGGLLVGGLIGMLLGNGLGGMAGFLGLILQVALFAGLAMLAMRFFANRNKTATAAAGAGSARTAQNFGQNFGTQFGKRDAQTQNTNARSSTSVPSAGFGADAGAASAASMMQPAVEEKPLTVGQEDLEHFEKMLTEVQTAYGQENYATLRQLATPEAMSYLAEELGENATNGLRNHVSDVKLLQGDVSEGWSEEGKDYATVAMRYESVDYMADRETGELAEGESTDVSESVEVWTFVRPANGRIEDWKLSAIQAA